MARIAKLGHFGKEVTGLEPRSQGRFQAMQFWIFKSLKGDPLAAPLLVSSFVMLADELQAATLQIAIIYAGSLAQFGREPGKPDRAMGTKLVEWSTSVIGIAGRQNAGPSPGGFLAELAFIHHLNTNALTGQEVGGSQANDPAAEDQDFR